MSCCKRREEDELYIDNSCANQDDAYARKCCAPETPLCVCRASAAFVTTNCNAYQTVNTPNYQTITTCLEPCQCAEEIEWNCYTPPKPSCKWLNNFCELRRQWSNHARMQSCKCCNCRPRINTVYHILSPVSVDNAIGGASDTCERECDDGWGEKNGNCNVISYIGNIGYNSLLPGPFAFVSFILLIFITIGLSSSLTIYRHYYSPKTCLKHSN